MDIDYRSIAKQLLRETVVKEMSESDLPTALAKADFIRSVIDDPDVLRFASHELMETHRRVESERSSVENWTQRAFVSKPWLQLLPDGSIYLNRTGLGQVSPSFSRGCTHSGAVQETGELPGVS